MRFSFQILKYLDLVDWGSCAYKCNKAQLLELVKITKCEIDNLINLDETVTYGIVFKECY